MAEEKKVYDKSLFERANSIHLHILAKLFGCIECSTESTSLRKKFNFLMYTQALAMSWEYGTKGENEINNKKA